MIENLNEENMQKKPRTTSGSLQELGVQIRLTSSPICKEYRKTTAEHILALQAQVWKIHKLFSFGRPEQFLVQVVK